MEEQILTVEQMLKLKEFGFDISCDYHSMNWGFWDGKYEFSCGISGKGVCRTFTLQDLITLVPDEISCDGKCYDLVINKDGFKYCKDSKDIHEFCNILHIECDDNLIISAYNMIIWLAENKYINMNK